jgi:hypothetical protein
MKCVWINSGKESLNVYLVSIGALSAVTLMLNANDENIFDEAGTEARLKPGFRRRGSC